MSASANEIDFSALTDVGFSARRRIARRLLPFLFTLFVIAFLDRVNVSYAALEMTLLGGTFAFPEGGTIALAGSDFGASVNGQPVALYTPREMERGEILKLGPTRTGARCYLCVAGGIDVAISPGQAALVSGGARPSRMAYSATAAFFSLSLKL